MELDIADDFELVVDDLELVTFRRKAAGTDTFTNIADITALRRAEKRIERKAPHGATVAVVSCRWHLDAEGTEGYHPAPRDRIRDAAGVEFVVERCDISTNRTRYVCDTTRLNSTNT